MQDVRSRIVLALNCLESRVAEVCIRILLVAVLLMVIIDVVLTGRACVSSSVSRAQDFCTFMKRYMTSRKGRVEKAASRFPRKGCQVKWRRILRQVYKQ